MKITQFSIHLHCDSLPPLALYTCLIYLNLPNRLFLNFFLIIVQLVFLIFGWKCHQHTGPFSCMTKNLVHKTALSSVPKDN